MDSTPIFQKLLSWINPAVMDYFHDLLLSVIDFEQSEASDMVVVKEGLCPELDAYRSTYDDMDDFLTETAKKQLEFYPSIERLYIEYLPQGLVISLCWCVLYALYA
jgi:hypothetical protein